MTTTRKIGIAFAVLVALLFAGTLYYFMPRANKVLITGTEVKRMDSSTPPGSAEKTRDVRFVYAKDWESKEALAFRNEDNAWYFKFDSGDVAAEAAKLANNDRDEVALVKYYGLRVAITHAYPNIISLTEVEPDYVYVPWFNMVVLVLLLILVIWGGVKLRRMFGTAKAKLSKRPEGS